MFKPTAYSEIQKRKKMMIGMHLVELSDRYHYFNIQQTKKPQKMKTSSFSQQQKDSFNQKQMATLPVTPSGKCPSFLEQTKLLISKQALFTPRIKLNRPASKATYLSSKNQLFEKKDVVEIKKIETFVTKQIPKLQEPKKKSLKIEITQPSDYDDFIDYVYNNKQFI